MKNLRQRIRKIKINCLPWRIWKGEIEYLPISSKALFSKYGMPIDTLEQCLKSEGYLFLDETLLEVLKEEKNLYRKQIQDIEETNSNFGLIPEDWTEEDYNYSKENQFV